MKELSLNILDIAENSVKAKATLTEIILNDANNVLTLTIKDNGCGMSEEVLAGVTNPFYTTRTTRKVGLGIPFLKLAAEQTEGSLKISSVSKDLDSINHGTTLTAVFNTDHIDFTPLGDVAETVITLIQGHPDTDFLFIHNAEGFNVKLDTRELKGILGDVPLNTFEVLEWIREYLKEQYSASI